VQIKLGKDQRTDEDRNCSNNRPTNDTIPRQHDDDIKPSRWNANNFETIKANLSLCSICRHVGVVGIAALIPNLDTRQKCVATFTPHVCFTPTGKPPEKLGRRLGGLQSLSGPFGRKGTSCCW